MSPKPRTLALLLLLPLLLALWIARYPHYLLKVPKIGFVLYNLAGGEIPGFFDGKIFEVEDRWHRKDDVILAVCSKCGTTWMMATLHHIRGHGRQAAYRDLYEEVRWPEFVYYPGQPMEERISILTRQHKDYPFSIYKTHKQPPVVHLRNDSRYIVGVRSALDSIASLRPFFRNHSPVFAKLWGGFPVEAGKPPSPEDEKVFEHMVLNEIGNGKTLMDIAILDHIRGWWPYRNEKNVLFVHYTNRIKHHTEEVARMANFVNVDLTNKELHDVADQTTFAAMKRNSDIYNFQAALLEFKERNLLPKELGYVISDLVNIGEKRSGLNELRPGFVKAIKDTLVLKLGPAVTQWLLEGGDVPDVDLPKQI